MAEPLTAREMVPLAADLGAVLLSAGAEIRQVEEGLYRLFEAQGLKAEVFVLLKGIFLSAWEPGSDPVTLIRHVRGGSGVDLGRLGRAQALTEALSAGNRSAGEIRKRIDELTAPGPEKRLLMIGAAAATAGIYGVFFGGSWAEAGWAAGLAAVVQTGRGFWGRWGIPSLVDTLGSSVLLALGALGAPWLIPGADPVRVVTGEVMILIPGVALVNGIKDVLHGDTVSSLYRLSDALLQTAAIAGGVALVLTWGWPHG